jgi:hypothetical protein
MNMIETIKRAIYGMSDDQLDAEHRAQKRLYAAEKELIEAALSVNYISQVQTIDVDRLEDALGDELPCESAWDEKISAARRHGEYRK